MKIKRVISVSKNGNRKEVIAEEDGRLYTKHIRLNPNTEKWIYCVRIEKETGQKILEPIIEDKS